MGAPAQMARRGRWRRGFPGGRAHLPAFLLLLLLAGCAPVAEARRPLALPASLPASQVRIDRIVDGDTVWLRAPQTGGLSRSARLMDFDTPETFRPGCERERALGLLAKARLGQILAGARRIDAGFHGQDRYRRELVRLWVDGRALSDVMISEGLAVPYHGGKRIDWCARLSRGG